MGIKEMSESRPSALEEELISRHAIRSAMQIKRAQIREYESSLSDRDDEVGKHARAVAEGRLLQIEQDISLTYLLQACEARGSSISPNISGGEGAGSQAILEDEEVNE
jgi:hypothetical protein